MSPPGMQLNLSDMIRALHKRVAPGEQCHIFQCILVAFPAYEFWKFCRQGKTAECIRGPGILKIPHNIALRHDYLHLVRFEKR